MNTLIAATVLSATGFISTTPPNVLVANPAPPPPLCEGCPDPTTGDWLVWHIKADCNGNQVIDFDDLNCLLDRWGETCAPIGDLCNEDLNGDGVIDMQDLDILLAMYGCPRSCFLI